MCAEPCSLFARSLDCNDSKEIVDSLCERNICLENEIAPDGILSVFKPLRTAGTWRSGLLGSPGSLMYHCAAHGARACLTSDRIPSGAFYFFLTKPIYGALPCILRSPSALPPVREHPESLSFLRRSSERWLHRYLRRRRD